MGLQVKILEEKAPMLPLLPLLHQLSPWIQPEEYSTMLDDMLPHGYRMMVAYDAEKPVGIFGIWVITKLYSGRYMELDNVVVDADYRSKGVGKIMLQACIELAKNEKCDTMMLDAYLTNKKGHVFYERAGFVAKGYHFLKVLNKGNRPF